MSSTDRASPGATAPAPAMARAPAGEVRIDVLKGDRCCARCGFNLHGQTIVREVHYQMLMVRCPECGAAASLQEYPSLTRVAWRIRMALAAAWLGAILLGMLFTAVTLGALSEATATNVVHPYTSFATVEFNDYSQRNATSPNNANWWAGNTQLTQWWDALPPEKLFADFGGWGKLAWRGLFYWVFVALALVPVGVVWSVALARLRGVRMAAVLLLPVAGTATIYAATQLTTTGAFVMYYSAYQLAEKQVAWLPTFMTIAFGGACLIVGGLIGRPIARAFLRLTLPARLLAAFSFLWLVDGKALPRPVPMRKGLIEQTER